MSRTLRMCALRTVCQDLASLSPAAKTAIVRHTPIIEVGAEGKGGGFKGVQRAFFAVPDF